jgi:hypothetical protein
VELLVQGDASFEVIGLPCDHGVAGQPCRDMFDLSAMLERHCALARRCGKRVHLSDVQAPSSQAAEQESPMGQSGGRVAPAGWWHRPWDAETQADWVEQFYTLALSKPEVDAVTWRSVGDRSAAWPHGGLLDRDGRPKPAFFRLKSLIQSVQPRPGPHSY